MATEIMLAVIALVLFLIALGQKREIERLESEVGQMSRLWDNESRFNSDVNKALRNAGLEIEPVAQLPKYKIVKLKK